MTGPVEFLEAAHKRAEKFVGLLPDGPWEWRGHNGPEGVYMALENRRDEVPVIRSHAQAGSSWLAWHPAFDEFLPEPEAVLCRVAAERKILAECKDLLAVDGWEFDDAPNLADTTICNLAEGWGRKGGDQ